MITLHGFGPAFGLPDPSPFVVKAEALLKLSGLPFETKLGNLRKAPKGKLPLIVDEGAVIADSTFIRLHLEERYGIDFDKELTPAQKGVAWAIEKMLEDHLYWLIAQERWGSPVNFDRGPRKFFEKVPALMRPMVIAMIGRQLRRTLHGQGLGRHSDAERAKLAARCVDSLAVCLGDKPFLMGEAPCGADATVFAFVSGGLCQLFDSAVRTRMEGHANLVAYRDRGLKLWFPQVAVAA